MDQKLLFLINREWTSAGLDRFMSLVSSWSAWVPFVLIAAAYLAWKGGFQMRAFLLVAGLVIGFNDGFLSRTLKRLADRPRPHQSVNDVRVVDLAKATPRFLAVFKPAKVKMSRITLDDVDGRSFPSSHTMNLVSFATAALCFFRQRALWTLLPAGLVAYSRIYTGAHWPSDVLVSTVLGIGSSLLLIAGLDLLWRTRAGCWFARWHAEHPRLLPA
jgi:undecaprenyl-diphosphatase